MPNAYLASPSDLQQLLLVRMGERGDLPGFSQSVQAIVHLIDDVEEGNDDFKLIQVVLTDASLTQKVLRLANSAMYSVFEGQVTTVSRAVAILGTQTVAHLALGLKVIESFQDGATGAREVKAEMHKAVLAGVLGREFASCAAGTRDSEEAAVCAVLHGLGRMLVAFYLPESWSEILRLHANGDNEDAACKAVITAPFEAVGQFIATRWGLPLKLVAALRHMGAPRAEPSLTNDDWLCTVGSAATKGAHILYNHPQGDPAALEQLVADYAPAIGANPSQLLAAIHTAKCVIDEMYSNKPVAADKLGLHQERALTAGLAELKTAAVRATLNQTVSLAVEFLHQTLGCTKSYFFLRAPKERCFKARLGLGAGAVELVANLRFDELFKPDMFHAAMAADKPLYVSDAKSPSVRPRLPLWWLASLGASQSFCVIPMASNRLPVGFLYLDWASAGGPQGLNSFTLDVLAQVHAVVAHSIARSREAVVGAREAALGVRPSPVAA